MNLSNESSSELNTKANLDVNKNINEAHSVSKPTKGKDQGEKSSTLKNKNKADNNETTQIGDKDEDKKK